MLGVLVLIIGIILLLQNLGLVAGAAWGIIWPILIILVGLGLINKRKHGHWKMHEHGPENQ